MRELRMLEIEASLKTPQVKGVSWSKANKAWVAQIRHCGYTTYIGSFQDEYLAHLAWVAVAKELQGEFFRQA